VSEPKRIRLSRQRGWRLPSGAVNVARPGRWGNPHAVVGDDGFWRVQEGGTGFLLGRFHTKIEATAVAVERFREDLEEGGLPYSLEEAADALAGFDLACWCPLWATPDAMPPVEEGLARHPCHADVLLLAVNPGIPSELLLRRG
jgi:hypothetical protein